MVHPPFVVRPVNWHASRDKLRAIRHAVFVEEQRVPEALEWDDADERAYHVLATSSEGEAIGTGRLKLDGQIGRMAVQREWRRRGVGTAILKVLGLTKSPLNKQTAKLAQKKITFSNRKISKELGFRYRSLEETLEWAKTP